MSCSIAKDYPLLIRRNADILCLLSKASPTSARKLIKNAPNDFLKAISLIAFNILNGYFVLEQQQVDRLTPYAKHIRTLSKKSLTGKKRRATLLHGGFLPALIGVLGAALAPKLIKSVLG